MFLPGNHEDWHLDSPIKTKGTADTVIPTGEVAIRNPGSSWLARRTERANSGFSLETLPQVWRAGSVVSALIALAEDWNWVPAPTSNGSQLSHPIPFDFQGHHTHMVYIHTYIQAHAHKLN